VAEIIKLTCPTCGGKLEITGDIERFACSYCGNEHMVIRRGGIVSLKPVVQELERVRAGTDRTVSELPLARLQKEIAQLEEDLDAVKPQSAKPIRALACLLVAAAFFAVSLATGRDPECCFFAAIITLIGIVFWAGWKRDNEKRSAERRQIETRLEAKQEEYRRHQEIVERM